MTKSQKITALNRWFKAIIDSNAQIVPLITGNIITVDGPMFKAVSIAQDATTAATAQIVGDGHEWLNWYYLENGMGTKAMDAGPLGKERPIKTVDDLLWVIEVTA